MRTCSRCKTAKEETEFAGKHRYCRPCDKTRKRQWIDANREEVNAYRREYEKGYRKTEAGITKAKQAYKKHYEKVKNTPELLKKRRSEGRKNNAKIRSTASGRILNTLRVRLWKEVKKSDKSDSTMTLIGLSIADLCNYLESLWLPGMTWENYGYKGWHIDHVRPCASFDLIDPEQQKQCFHWTNLQPLWAIDNMKKSSKWSIE